MPLPASVRALLLVGAASFLVTACGASDAATASTAAFQNVMYVTNIDVTVDGCGGDPGGESVTISPWRAYVMPDAEVTWTAHGAGIESMTVRAKRRGQGNWPFDWGAGWFQRHERATSPGQAVLSAGPASHGRQNTPHGYDVIVRCGDQDLVIDPEIIIRPTD